MVSTLSTAPRGSIVLLQACAHNPTGVDPTEDQWKTIAQVLKDHGLIPFFDCAYQGFASGSLSRDNFAIRFFSDQGFDMFIAQSFSKNLGLYGQRVGCFHFVASPGLNAQDTITRVQSQLSALQRTIISNPPIYGAKIASIILNDEELLVDWRGDMRTMSGRIIKMRHSLKQALTELRTPGDWSHITRQIGMFAYTGLSEAQVLELRNKWHVYMTEDGRMNMAGLTTGTVNYFAQAIDDVVRRAAQ
jgi:aspartate aminotransferase, cytoplasmic